MKIVVINETLDWNKGGGAEKVVKKQVEALRSRGHEVYIIGFSQYGEEEDGYVKAIKMPDSPVKREISRLSMDTGIKRDIRRYLNELNPDVIQLHNINVHTLAILKAVEDFNVVMTVHDYNLICPTGWNLHSDMSVCPSGYTGKCRLEHKRDWNFFTYRVREDIFRKREKMLKNVVDCFLTSTDDLKKYLGMRGYHDVKKFPLLLGHERENQSRKICHLDLMHEKDILFVGSMEKNKGIYQLYNTFKELIRKTHHKDARLIYAGNGSELENLRSLVDSEYMNSHILFMGRTNHVDSHIKNCGVVVVPSIWCESYGIVTYEAMKNCRAVLVSNRAGSRELVSRDMQFNPLNTEELKNKLDHVLSNRRVIDYGFKAGMDIENLVSTDEEVITYYEDLYKNIITLKLLE